MPTTERAFPIAFRALAVTSAVVALAWFVPAAAAVEDPPTAAEVREARERADQLLDELGRLRSELAEIQDRLARASARVEQQEGLLAETEAELLDTQQRLRETRERYEAIIEQLSARAREAFILGPGSSVEVLLGATSLADLSDRIVYVDAVAEADAGLANEAANLRAQLEAQEARLEELRAERERRLAATQAERDAVLADLERQRELTAQIAARTADAKALAAQLAKDRRQYLRELAAQQAAGGHAPIPLPAAYRGILKVCPVGTPRGFGDGFGAPRYVGGYHPHRGVDIVAPEGTPVYAPFDGYARDASNIYGGTAVIVEGRYGYVYNAHLGRITKLGPVSAGDVIGTVSSTGLAGGTTPHNHFEFHPRVIPSNWIVSAYGYAVIDTAINPYPLLVAACG
jgi:murein DD-endopeptidase MepM/ murein hydrolase activator NlpD